MFFKHTASVFLTQIITFAVTLLANIILARTLGPAGKGQVTLLMTFAFLASLISSLGVSASAVYYVNRDTPARPAIISTSLVMQLGSMLVVLLAAAALTPWIVNELLGGAVSPRLLWLTLLTLPFMVLVGALSNLLIGLREIYRSNYVRFAQVGVQLVSFLILLVVMQLGTAGAIIGFGIATACAALLGVYFAYRMGLSLFGHLSRSWIRPLLNYGLKSWLGNLLQYFNYRLDVFILNLLVGAASLGLYSVAVGLAEIIWYIPTAVAVVLFPKTASDWNAATQFTPLVARNALFVTILAALGMSLICVPLISLFGQEFLPAVWPFLALLPGVVCLGVGKILASDLAGRGKPHYGAWSALIALVGTVVLDFLLIPRWEAIGAAAASTISYCLSTGILLYLYLRISGNSARSVLWIQSSDLRMYVTLAKQRGGNNRTAA